MLFIHTRKNPTLFYIILIIYKYQLSKFSDKPKKLHTKIQYYCSLSTKWFIYPRLKISVFKLNYVNVLGIWILLSLTLYNEVVGVFS